VLIWLFLFNDDLVAMGVISDAGSSHGSGARQLLSLLLFLSDFTVSR